MYRRYENPYELEERLKEAKKRLTESPDDIDLAIEVAELEERVDIAWEDDEAEANGWD